MVSDQALLDEFNEVGLVIIHDALSHDELATLNAGLDADIAARPTAWPQRSPGTIQSTEVLTPLPGETGSVFDPLIRHDSSLPLLRTAYQDDMAFSEVSPTGVRTVWGFTLDLIQALQVRCRSSSRTAPRAQSPCRRMPVGTTVPPPHAHLTHSPLLTERFCC